MLLAGGQLTPVTHNAPVLAGYSRNTRALRAGNPKRIFLGGIRSSNDLAFGFQPMGGRGVKEGGGGGMRSVVLINKRKLLI